MRVEFVPNVDGDASQETLDLFCWQLDHMGSAVLGFLREARDVLSGKKRREIRCQWDGNNAFTWMTPMIILLLWHISRYCTANKITVNKREMPQ